MSHWLPTSEVILAYPRVARSSLRNSLLGWCASLGFHGAVVCCFLVTAKQGPQLWSVVRGYSSVGSAPSIDARAGGLLAKFAEQTQPIQMELIDVPDVSATDQVRPASRIVTEIAQHSAQIAAIEEAELLVSVLVSQLADIPRKSKESAAEPLVMRADPEAIRDQDLLQAVQPMTIETNSPSNEKSENSSSGSDGNPTDDSAVSSASAASNGVTTNPPSDDRSEDGSSDRAGNATEDSVASTASAASNGAGDSPVPQAAATNPAPPYPEDARAAGLQGTVTLRLRIGADGRVESVKLLASSGTSSLDESAMTTVKRWRFEPARRFGRPVAMDVKTSVKFEIEAE